VKTKKKDEEKKEERPSVHHSAYASCTCGWSCCISAVDKVDLYRNAVPAVDRKARFHPCPRKASRLNTGVN
jgi:hypothetical protein